MLPDGSLDATYVTVDLPRSGRVKFVVREYEHGIRVATDCVPTTGPRKFLSMTATLLEFGRDVLGLSGEVLSISERAQRYVEKQARFSGETYTSLPMVTDHDAITEPDAPIPQDVSKRTVVGFKRPLIAATKGHAQ
jgi:hypothetical protein